MSKIELENMVNELYGKGTPPEVIQDMINQNGLEEDYDVVGEDVTEEVVFTKEMQEEVRKILDTFPELEKQVIIYRFGFYGNDRLSRNEIAKKLNTTLDKVRGAEERAMKRFKHPMNYKKIKDYIEPTEMTYKAEKTK